MMCYRMRIQVVIFLVFFRIAGAELPNDINDLPIANITPTDEIFSVYFRTVPTISAEEYTLSVTGTVDQPLSFTLDEIKQLPSTEVMSTLQCIGNRPGFGWIANAVWKGVRLSTVLDMAGVQQGSEGIIESAEDGFVSALDLARATMPETLLVYEVNGDVLPATLGFPLRVIAPGVYGLRQVMWVRTLEVMGEGFQDYVDNVIGLPPDPDMEISSELLYPLPGSQVWAFAPVQLYGYAIVDGLIGVERVELSFDGMQTWQPARLYRNGTLFSWVLWGFEWVPQSLGSASVWIRATDMNGTPQPENDPNPSDGYNPIMSTSFEVVPGRADINGDQVIDFRDLALLMQQWRQGTPQ